MVSVWKNNGSNAMRELPIEDAEEERFQADLEIAVRQSLGITFTFYACIVQLFLSYVHLRWILILNTSLYSSEIHFIVNHSRNKTKLLEWSFFGRLTFLLIRHVSSSGKFAFSFQFKDVPESFFSGR